MKVTDPKGNGVAKVDTAYQPRTDTRQAQLYCQTCDLYLDNWTLL